MTTSSGSQLEELNPFVIAQRQCDNAARYLPGLEPGSSSSSNALTS